MKFIFRLIGMLVVLLILVMAVLCYLDTKALLSGKLEHLIGTLRILGQEAWAEIRYFMSDSGIAEDAAGLLDQGANYLRDSVAPQATDKPGAYALSTPTPEGFIPFATATPEGYVPTASPVPTATPVPTASPVPADYATPVPTATPHIITVG